MPNLQDVARDLRQARRRAEAFDMRPLAALLRARRERLGLTQLAIEAELNLKHGTVSEIETGVLTPSLGLLGRLARRLNLKLTLVDRGAD